MHEPSSNGVSNAKQNRSLFNINRTHDQASCDMLDESAFTRMLALERKRAERSSRRFVVLLLEADNLLKAGSDSQPIHSIIRALFSSTRDTDIKGWYESASVLGVIFTEIGTADGRAVSTALLTRITDALSSVLSIDQINKIRLSIHVFPRDSSDPSSSVDFALYPDLASDADGKKASRAVKRVIDVVGSLFAIVAFSPVLLATCIVIKFTSRGPVLFRQERIGQYGKRFVFLKFRSMFSGNDPRIHEDYVKRLIQGNAGTENGNQRVYKLTNDPRVTTFGKFLRRTSLDEFPQFFNVLIGDMSLVGPRPPVPYEFENYATWHQKRLIAVKPGITGLWQVWGRSRVTFDDMVRLDLQYASGWSVWLDLKILWSTPAAVFSRQGAF